MPILRDNENAAPVKPTVVIIGAEYRHWKTTAIYTVLGTAMSADNGKELVLYTASNLKHTPVPTVWARERTSFIEVIPVDQAKTIFVNRFELLEKP